MVALFVSSAIAALMTLVIVIVGKRRPPGTPLTWGEAFVGGVWVFVLMLLVYGVIPHHWLAWADNELGWRTDNAGIPTGPIKSVNVFGQVLVQNHHLWGSPQDISFLGFLGPGRGRVQINAQVLRDIIAATMYIVFLAINFYMILWWQKRTVTEKSDKPVVTKESPFGRPVTQEA